MHWTKLEPIDGLKCIVRTDMQKLFPAVYQNGTWWHSNFDEFEIRNVCTWIPYPDRQPEYESLNDEVPAEVLLKYLIRDYRAEQEKVKQLRKLNEQLVKAYNDLKKAFNRMEADNATRNYENTFRTLKEQYEQEKVLCHRYKDTLLRIRGILSAKKLMLTEADEQTVEADSVNQPEL